MPIIKKSIEENLVTTAQTSDFTAEIENFYKLDLSGSDVDVYLPSASGFGSQDIILNVTTSGANVATVYPSGSDTVGNAPTLTLESYETVTLTSDGDDNWIPMGTTAYGGGPAGPALGQLFGTYPGPSVIGLTESGGTALSLGSIADGETFTRSGSTIIGTTPGVLIGVVRYPVGGGTPVDYSTITAALAAASSGDSIKVPPGTYAESITIPDGVAVDAIATQAVTIISGAAATGTRVIFGETSSLRGFTITFPTDAVPAISYAGSGTAETSELILVGSGANGRGIVNSGVGTLFASRSFCQGTAASILENTGAGNLICETFIVDGSSTITDIIKGSAGHIDIDYLVTHSGTGTYTNIICAEGTSHFHIFGSILEGGTNAVHITSDTTEVEILGCLFNADTYDLLVDPAVNDAVIKVIGSIGSRNKMSVPADATQVLVAGIDSVEGDEAFVINAELAVGNTALGRESVFGEGDSYTFGMKVLTTDDTAGAAADGGNLTDVSTAAASASGSTFSFQGVAADHSILIGCTLSNATPDKLKHWGIKVLQTTAAVEVTPKSFVFEIWNGSAWTEFNIMATHSSLFHRYANEVFIRANTSEHVRYGLNENDTWAKKTINGIEAYWSRIRIDTTVTTAPVFQQFKLSSNRSEINADGTHTFHGSSRFRKTIFSGGNVFGESGAVADVSLTVGTGGLPTGWSHNIKNSELNANGDAIMTQLALPRGIDTSRPLNFRIIYTPTPAAADNISLIFSILPIEVEGVPEADSTGGITPVARTLANCETLTAKVAQTQTNAESAATNGKIYSAIFDGFDVSDYYEGDIIFIRLELDNDGASTNADIAVLAIEVSAVQWTHGDKLQEI